MDNNNLCKCCNKPFSNQNVYSAEGWAETKISGLCEKCFDSITLINEDDVDLVDELEKKRDDDSSF